MKILAIGYYDDFARFFLAIKRELNVLYKSIQFRYLSLYLSGFLYFILRFQRASFMPLLVKLSVLKNKKKYQKIAEKGIYHGINLNEVVTYHLRLDAEKPQGLLLQAVGYIVYFERYLAKYSPDVLLLSGDSRMAIQILDALAQQKKIKTYYFEQGPFGTTIWDHKGVNANAAIRECSNFPIVEGGDKPVLAFLQRQRRPAYRRNVIYRASDYAFQALFGFLRLLPIDIKMQSRVGQCVDDYQKIAVDTQTERQKTILLILQVPYDVNMVFHSPFYSNHADIVKDVYNSLPSGYQLIIREHPLYTGRYEGDLYTFMKKNNIALDGLGLEQSIKSAAVVVVNNSTVGIEAIAANKPVVILGNCYYDNADIALKLSSRELLPELLHQALSFSAEKDKIMQFLHYFLFDFLIDGHFRDKELIAPKRIAGRILND